ncbi:uncharacterized protein ISCGN_001875 [Ixodes scapularis]
MRSQSNPVVFLVQIFTFFLLLGDFFSRTSLPGCLPRQPTSFVILLPRPEVLCCCIADRFDALCSLVLLLSGDGELNPGPRTTSVTENPSKDNQSKQMDEMLQLLQDVNAPILKFETGEASLISSIDKVRKSQQSMENKLADVNKRLVNVETKALKLDEWQSELQATQRVADEARKENTLLRSRLDELEDRNRRDNLIIHGIEDSDREHGLNRRRR